MRHFAPPHNADSRIMEHSVPANNDSFLMTIFATRAHAALSGRRNVRPIHPLDVHLCASARTWPDAGSYIGGLLTDKILRVGGDGPIAPFFINTLLDSCLVVTSGIPHVWYVVLPTRSAAREVSVLPIIASRNFRNINPCSDLVA
jgi:hypothetical protein